MIFLSKEQRKLKKGLVKCKNHFIRTFRPRYDELINTSTDEDIFYQKSIDLRIRYLKEFTDILKEKVGEYDFYFRNYDNLLDDFVNVCLTEYISVIKGIK